MMMTPSNSLPHFDPFYPDDPDYKLIMMVETCRRKDELRLEQMIHKLQGEGGDPEALLGNINSARQLFDVIAYTDSVRVFELILNAFSKTSYMKEQAAGLLENLVKIEASKPGTLGQGSALQKTILLLEHVDAKKVLQQCFWTRLTKQDIETQQSNVHLLLKRGSVDMFKLMLQKGLSLTHTTVERKYDLLCFLEDTMDMDVHPTTLNQEWIYQKTKQLIQEGLNPLAPSPSQPNGTQQRWQDLIEQYRPLPYLGLLKAYTEAGMDINWQNPRDNSTLLHEAIIMCEDVEMTKGLLHLGASLKAITSDKISLWELAMVDGVSDREMIEVLIDQDVDWDIVIKHHQFSTYKKQSPLEYLIPLINEQMLAHILTKTTPEPLFKKTKEGLIKEPLTFTRQAACVIEDAVTLCEREQVPQLLISAMEQVLLKKSLPSSEIKTPKLRM